MRYFLIYIIFVPVVFAADKWFDDLNLAIKTAQQDEKNIFVYFADENECGMCSFFKKEIVSQPKFIAMFNNIILCRVDPQKQRDSEILEKYRLLFKQFHIEEIPTVMFMTPTGKVFFRGIYNGEKLSLYTEYLRNILDIQQFYNELVKQLKSNSPLSSTEQNYLCKELVTYMEKCPQEASILKVKYAQILFYLDTANITQKRPYAAYILCLYTQIKKDVYLEYLKKFSSHENSYYEQLLDQYFWDHAQKLADLHNAALPENSQLIPYAKQILLEIEKHAFIPISEERKLNILITKALCYRSIGENNKLESLWKEMKTLYPAHDKVKFFGNLIGKQQNE